MKTIPPGLLEEMTRRLAEEFKPDAVILFGSHAWGQPGEDSDVDLLVILPGDTSPQVQDETRAYRCLRGVPAAKDILLKSRAQVERYRLVPASLERKIMERGKVLYGRGESARERGERTQKPEWTLPQAEGLDHRSRGQRPRYRAP